MTSTMLNPTGFDPATYRNLTPSLYAAPNPHATARANGVRFHGYPDRRRAIDCIVLHTAETLPGWSTFTAGKGDSAAEAVARYASTTDRTISFHATADADSIIKCLPDQATGFHVSGWNSRALGIEIATQAHRWNEAPAEWVDAIITNTARVVAVWCIDHNITPQRANKAIIYAGGTGILTHAELDPTRRTDPGADFPWALFMTRLDQLLNPTPPTPAHPPLLAQPLTLVDRVFDVTSGGEWWLIDDGGIANVGGAPYFGHLLDPRTRSRLSAALDLDETALAYHGRPISIRRSTAPYGYTVWTDQNRSYTFHAGTV